MGAGDRLLECACGAEVRAEEILSTAYDLRAVGPDFLYVKFRCSRCGRLGEHRIEQPPAGPRHAPVGDVAAGTPPISSDEATAFREALAAPGALERLLRTPPPTDTGDSGDPEGKG